MSGARKSKTGDTGATDRSTEEKRHLVALVCSQCVTSSFQPQRAADRVTSARLQLVLLPCTSKLEVGNLLGILDRGADGILVAGCLGTRCQFQVGSARAAKRIDYAQRLLDEIGIGGWRLRISLDGARSEDDVARLANELAEAVAASPPNPVGKPAQRKDGIVA